MTPILTEGFPSLRKDQCTRLWKESGERKASFLDPENLKKEELREKVTLFPT